MSLKGGGETSEGDVWGGCRKWDTTQRPLRIHGFGVGIWNQIVKNMKPLCQPLNRDFHSGGQVVQQ